MPTLPYVIHIILWLLAAFSILTWTILLVKAIVFTRQRRANRHFIGRFSRVKNAGELPQLVRTSSGNLSGSISTILGLLGTVWSIMNLLKAISTFNSAGLDIVAGPIGDALITTAVGIIVAVPALLGHNFFVRRIRVALMEMERFCEMLQHLAIRSGFRI